jgi:peptidoglycan/xylan/chitin deacetylase (PgdA/CDA1 family)
VSGRLARWALSLAHRRRARRAPALTVVRHHRVFDAAERPLYRIGVTAAVLEAQVATLARAGLAPVTLAEGLARLAAGAPRTVAFTFDDGYADNVHRALPVLARHGARATFYLTAGLMEERRAPWWDELEHLLARTASPALRWSADGRAFDLALGGHAARVRALATLVPALRVPPARQRARLAELGAALGVASPAPCALATWDEGARLAAAGMEVGAHTLGHPFLSLLPAAEQRREIAGSLDLIERRLGVRPAGLAYPGGDHDDVTVAEARACGLEHAVTTRRGDVVAGDDPHRLARRGLSEGACLGPWGGHSARMTLAEVDGAFDRLRGAGAGTAA